MEICSSLLNLLKQGLPLVLYLIIFVLIVVESTVTDSLITANSIAGRVFECLKEHSLKINAEKIFLSECKRSTVSTPGVAKIHE